MTLTVDVVVVGASANAVAAVVEAATNGKRVLVITKTQGPELRRRIRRELAGVAQAGRVTVLAGAEVQCIAGIRSVEAVLARDVRSGRRVDINATALLTFDDEPETGRTNHDKE